MNPTDDTPDTEATDQYVEFTAPTAPDPTDTPTFAETYATAHGVARTVLEQTGLDIGRNADLVTTVLGAALLELERPWRDELQAARQAAVALHRRTVEFREQIVRERQLRDSNKHLADYLHERLDSTLAVAHRRGLLLDEIGRILDHQILEVLEEGEFVDINALVGDVIDLIRGEMKT